MNEGIQFAELLAYTQQETARWKAWFRDHMEALDVPCDIAGGKTIRDLLFHIFFVELNFAHLVQSLPKPDYTTLPRKSLDELFGVSEDAAEKIRQLFASVTDQQLTESLPIGFRDLKASRRKMLAQVFVHGIHHRGQLAFILRQRGFKDLWIHDILISDAMK